MKLLHVFFLFLLPAMLKGQDEFVHIQWDTTENYGPFHFPNALYEDGENTLPYYTRLLPWNAEGMIPVVSIEVKETIPDEGSRFAGVPAGHVKTSPLLEYRLVKQAGVHMVSLKILPFLLNDEGNLEMVGAMKIHIDEEEAIAGLKIDRKGNWVVGSVLATGNWSRVSVESSGIHKLTFEQLKELGMQDPAGVKVYGSGGQMVPERFSEGYVDDLSPVPVHWYKGSDGIVGPGDHLLFYARGPVSWSFDQEDSLFVQQLHPYSWKGYYFLTDSKGSAPAATEAALSTEAITHTVTSFDHRDYLEEETYNLIESGREWFGDVFNVSLEKNYPFALPGRIQGETVRIRIAVAARSNETSRFNFKANNQALGSAELKSTDLSTYSSQFAYEQVEVFDHLPGNDNLTITLDYLRPNSNSEGWLNSITLNGRSRLTMEGDELSFRDTRSTGMGNISEFRVENCNANTLIWDISDPGNPLNISYSLNGSTASFRLSTGLTREFIAFRQTGNFPAPVYSGEGLGPMQNQDLHGLQQPDMVIITPEIFLDAATELAMHRQTFDGLEVEVVLQQQVFNEFSSGTPDVTAIRNFMKMFYDRSGGSEAFCRYLLLFGDGSYDNRNHTAFNPNLILTYQSPVSLSPTRSYVSDDYFGLLDTDESMYDGLLDIGIGRFPVSTQEEAENLVRKTISYSELAYQGQWRNQICFIGDDEDGGTHMRQADELAEYVKDFYPSYNINKIYLDAYPQVKGATGFRYPGVSRAINDQMNRGALIINYTGHGGPNGLAHERVLTMNDIDSWTNQEMLPLFMTATCEFSRYDEYDKGLDQEITSAGEEVLLSTEGGGIGLFTTTRLVYSGPNHALNEVFYEIVFDKDSSKQNYRLGDIIAYSKNHTGPGVNKRNFTLLGDPSLRLAYPEHKVVTDSINGMEVSALQDTLSAFEWVTVSGHLESQVGDFMDDFNGFVYPVVFDKEKNVETLSNDNEPVFNFKSQNSVLYSGKATVTGGRFTFGFYVPKDINYAFGRGKISYYSNNSLVDAHGSFDGFSVGGIGIENATDMQPPVIELFMNDSLFVPGGITDPHPTLLAYVSDNFGINTTGNGIGHDLTATLDGDRINAIILNEFYQANTNSHYSGRIRYPFNNLEEGRHEVAVKIWDIHNNSAQSTLEFVVVDSEEMLIEKLYNYPNPFIDQTFFNIEHNRPDQELRLVLSIYSLSGELVRIIDTQIFSAGYRLDPVIWDGSATGGKPLGGGVYIYRATLSSEGGEVAAESGKLVIAR